MRYIDYFLSLKCASDVLITCNPIQNPCKEISESMTILMQVRKIVLKKDNKMKYNILDLCAGNALTSVTGIHFLPITNAIAVDIKGRKRKWERVNRFEYKVMNIFDNEVLSLINDKTIIISSHPCQNLAKRIVDLYNISKAQHLIMIPCCVATDLVNKHKMPRLLRKKLNTYELWCSYLGSQCKGKVDIMKDNHCLSPKNIVICAST